MWQLENVNQQEGKRPEGSIRIDVASTDQFDHENQFVLSQIRTYLAKDDQAPFEYDGVNFDNI